MFSLYILKTAKGMKTESSLASSVASFNWYLNYKGLFLKKKLSSWLNSFDLEEYEKRAHQCQLNYAISFFFIVTSSKFQDDLFAYREEKKRN